MINVSAWPVIAKLFFGLTPFGLCLVAHLMIAYTTAARDYYVACTSITSNAYLENLKLVWGDGRFKWRWMLVGVIGGILAFPWLLVRAGKIDVEELRAFPRRLKNRLVTAVWLNLIGFVWMLFAACCVTFHR